MVQGERPGVVCVLEGEFVSGRKPVAISASIRSSGAFSFPNARLILRSPRQRPRSRTPRYAHPEPPREQHPSGDRGNQRWPDEGHACPVAASLATLEQAPNLIILIDVVEVGRDPDLVPPETKLSIPYGMLQGHQPRHRLASARDDDLPPQRRARSTSRERWVLASWMFTDIPQGYRIRPKSQ